MTKLQEEIKLLKESLSNENYFKSDYEKRLAKTKLVIEALEKQIAEKENEATGE